jgi:hypothetical protein
MSKESKNTDSNLNKNITGKESGDTRRADSNLNRDINRNFQNERFPESNVGKNPRKDSDPQQKDDSEIEALAEDVSGTVSERTTDSSSPADIAGVADLDRGLGRARRK